MDAIKKKMMSLASETAQAEARAKSFEEEAIAATTLADKTEEQGSVSKYLISCLQDYLVLMACMFSYFFLRFYHGVRPRPPTTSLPRRRPKSVHSPNGSRDIPLLLLKLQTTEKRERFWLRERNAAAAGVE